MADVTDPLVTFTAYGEAQTSGSKSIGRTKDGRSFVRQDDKTHRRPAWKREIRNRAVWAQRGAPLIDGPIRMDVTFFRPRPKGHYKTSGGLSAHGDRNPYPATRPDVDKLVRLLNDELKGICWRDDGQVVLLVAQKMWGEPARTIVEIRNA